MSTEDHKSVPPLSPVGLILMSHHGNNEARGWRQGPRAAGCVPHHRGAVRSPLSPPGPLLAGTLFVRSFRCRGNLLCAKGRPGFRGPEPRARGPPSETRSHPHSAPRTGQRPRRELLRFTGLLRISDYDAFKKQYEIYGDKKGSGIKMLNLGPNHEWYTFCSLSDLLFFKKSKPIGRKKVNGGPLPVW